MAERFETAHHILLMDFNKNLTIRPHYSYQKQMKRDLRLDTFRGLFLVWMAVNHLSGPLHAYLFQTLGFVSSAEPFVFISGVTAGMVYSRIGLQEGCLKLRKRAIRRALDIYLFHIATFFFIVLLELFITSPSYRSFFVNMNPLPIDSPLIALGLAAIFMLQPALLDILPMYCLYLLITPFIINRFKTKWGPWWVLGGSILIWSLATYNSWDGLDRYCKRFLPGNLGFFNPFAWQFLFISGLFFGFRRTMTKALLVNKYLIIPSLLIWLGLMLLRYGVLPPNLFGYPLDSLTIRESFGPLRVINFAVLAYLITCLGIRFPRLFEWPFFSYLGQHSLQVFSFHVALIYLTRPLYDFLIPNGWTAIFLFNLFFVGCLALPAWLHVKFRELTNS
jgi:hypothetical protein